MKPANLVLVDPPPPPSHSRPARQPPPQQRARAQARAQAREREYATGDSDPEPDASPLLGLLGDDWQGKSKQQCYAWLVDAFRMRVEDEYTMNGNLYGSYADSANYDSNGSCALNDFSTFLAGAHAHRVLPDWWLDGGRATHDKACFAFAARRVRHAVEKSDMQEAHGPMGPMFLRGLAERVTGIGLMDGGGLGDDSDEEGGGWVDSDDDGDWQSDQDVAPGAPRVVVWCGGMLSYNGASEEHFYVDHLRDAAEALDGSFAVYERNERAEPTMLTTLRSAGCLVVLSADGGQEEYLQRRDASFRDGLRAWTQAGGVLCWHGGIEAVEQLQWLFPEVAQPWTMRGDFYRRCDTQLNRGCAGVPQPAMGALPAHINAKACMVSDVPPEHQLYSPPAGAVAHSLVNAPGFAGTAIQGGMCSIAAAPFGQGHVVFFGDVNAEEETCAALMRLACCNEAP